MKQQSEKRTEVAVRLLIETLTQNLNDTETVLDEFEATHNDWECSQSKEYAALVAGHFALKAAIERINNQLKRGDDGRAHCQVCGRSFPLNSAGEIDEEALLKEMTLPTRSFSS